MNLLTRNTDYAVQALLAIAESGERLSVADLCREVDLPRPFLRGLLQTLAKSGLVESVRGKGGGFRLLRDPEKISLYDVMEVFQNPMDTGGGCRLKKKPCPRQNGCGLRRNLRRIEATLVRELKGTTLASLAG